MKNFPSADKRDYRLENDSIFLAFLATAMSHLAFLQVKLPMWVFDVVFVISVQVKKKKKKTDKL